MRIGYFDALPPLKNPPRRDTGAKRIGAAPAVTIPTLSEEVPAGYSLGRIDDTAWRFFAAGLVKQAELSTTTVELAMAGNMTPTELACQAAREIIQAKCSQLTNLNISVQIGETYASVFDYEAYDLDQVVMEFDVDPDRPHLYLATSSLYTDRGCPSRLMQPVFKSLKTPAEQAIFCRALRMVERLQWRYAWLATPRRCYAQVSFQHWNHNASEVGYHNECWSWGIEEVDMAKLRKKGMAKIYPVEYTMEKLKKKLGPMMYVPRGPMRLSAQDIEQMSEAGSPAARAIAKAVVTGTRVIRAGKDIKTPTLSGSDHENISASAVLRWNRGDDVIKIFDDYANYTAGYGANTTDSFGVSVYQCDRIESAVSLVQSIEMMCDELNALNELIGAISIPED